MENNIKTVSSILTSAGSSEENAIQNVKPKSLCKKRKRCSSESSIEDEIILPDNALETERKVHASAVKNNLDETSVRKIIKKVVTNDHVLALVKLREEEEISNMNSENIQPKLTRAKVKELLKVSPTSTAWDIENLELTPINRIPVKTRPEVKALIAQELPEDEDDEEYEPTNDDVPSDDDHIESCSDLDSQPRTPATPVSLHADSPQVIRDGPFKVPQDVSSARRKLQIDEEAATIALRTRSKLSLSSTSIEHIESTFVPPDDIPMPDVDDLWNEFLNECLNPASTSKNEDDDETDPEYNVAADPDAQDEDEESLGRSIIKISKKELSDLVTELFSVMPPELEEVGLNPQSLSNSVLTDTSQSEITRWQGKQEPVSDEEEQQPSKRLQFENSGYSPFTNMNDKSKNNQGKATRETEKGNAQKETEDTDVQIVGEGNSANQIKKVFRPSIRTKNRHIEISIEEHSAARAPEERAPPSLRSAIQPLSETVCIKIDSSEATMTEEQILILQQQIRQHVQLATSNFLQVFTHPVHWTLASTYKDYLAALSNLVEQNENSVVDVCNLKPAYELVLTWEASVSEDTEVNREMVKFIREEVVRSRRRVSRNSFYGGEFHEIFKKVVSNSSVFLYPYLLPSVPYRPDPVRRFSYLPSEDKLLVLGLDQFWDYVENNRDLFKVRSTSTSRQGLTLTMELVAKHMFPWLAPRALLAHLQNARTQADLNNPIYRYFKFNEVPKIEHKLLPFNPSITLYEQPEHEMPRIWLKYLAKTSKRFRNYLHTKPFSAGRPPEGVLINPGVSTHNITKKPLPIDFTKKIISHRATLYTNPEKPELTNRIDLNIQRLEVGPEKNQTPETNTDQNPTLVGKNYYRLVETSTGAFLVPFNVNTQTVNTNTGSITTPAEIRSKIVANNLPENRPKTIVHKDHCLCCVLLKKICKERQMMITDYFKSKQEDRKCDCSNIKYPNVTNRLKLLVNNHKNMSGLVYNEIEHILSNGARNEKTEIQDCDTKDLIYVLTYQLKVFTQASMCKKTYVKKQVHNLLSNFDLEKGDPTALASALSKACDVELVDLYLDFLSFLTPEQVDKMNLFKDYFTRNCAKDLLERIMDQVRDKDIRHTILAQLKSIFTDSKSTSCEMCSGLLEVMKAYPKLARFTFDLFPHRKENRSQMCGLQEVNTRQASHNETTEMNDTACDDLHNTVDYEADNSSSNDDSDAMEVDLDHESGCQVVEKTVKMEPLSEESLKASEESLKPSEDATKTSEESSRPSEDASKTSEESLKPSDDATKTSEESLQPSEDASKTSEESLKPSEDASKTSDESNVTNNVKSELEMSEWKRDEDKIVLQVLQEHLSPEERHGKTILDITKLLEEKNIYDLLSQGLINKSLSEIKERVLLLLSVVVLSVDLSSK